MCSLRPFHRLALGLYAILFLASLAPASAQTAGSVLMADLGCVHCHTDLPTQSTLRDRAPDLSGAGLRYQPGYLFAFLQNPTKIRQHLGRARMPDFHLRPEEALALVTFLEAQRQTLGQWPPLPPAIVSPPSRQPVTKAQFHAELAQGLICLNCHTLDGQGGRQAVEFGDISQRLRPEWVQEYLVAPARYGVPPTTMPAQFYGVATNGTQFRELVPGAAQKIQTVTEYLFSLNAPARQRQDQQLAAARATHPNIAPVLGERLFVALNCASCHRHQTLLPPSEPVAPTLSAQGSRVTRTWLESYLTKPHSIRWSGYHPGDGSRMPDFHLSPGEVRDITGHLMAQTAVASDSTKRPPVKRLSAFARTKVQTLLTGKLSCLGCHRLGDRGGRIGPDLTMAKGRLQPHYVHDIITDPRKTAPHSIMPKVPLTEETAGLIAAFLTQQTQAPARSEYPLLTEFPLLLASQRLSHGTTPQPPAGTEATAERYRRHCAVCHGHEGKGDGFNARFLGISPTVHSDTVAMSKRPDDTLFDAIASGGYVVNKSHRMPPWEGKFSPVEIRDLVSHIRSLCQCQGPAWSLDHSKAR